MSREDRKSKFEERKKAIQEKTDARKAKGQARVEQGREALRGAQEAAATKSHAADQRLKDGLAGVADQLRENNEHAKEGFAAARADKADRDTIRHDDYEATKAQNAADWAAKKDELREDRKDRTLGGWGRKKRSE